MVNTDTKHYTFFYTDWNNALGCYTSDYKSTDSTCHLLRILRVLESCNGFKGKANGCPELPFLNFAIQFKFHLSEILMSCQLCVLVDFPKDIRYLTKAPIMHFYTYCNEHTRPKVFLPLNISLLYQACTRRFTLTKVRILQEINAKPCRM